jgi:hypothetical protein
VVINLRDAARQISGERRRIVPERNLVMPTVVDPTVRRRSRDEAKRALGLDPAKKILLSVAREVKYITYNGLTYAERHLPILEAHPEAELVVVGVGAPPDWKPAIKACSGRIRPFASQADPRPFYEAGDIYVDSYPFVSSTSMMEAAGYGMPTVTMFEAPEGAEIVGINHVGLAGGVAVAHSAHEYFTILTKLLSDCEAREEAAERARRATESTNVPPAWLNYLNEVFASAATLPPVEPDHILSAGTEQPAFGEPDRRHQDMFGDFLPLSKIVQWSLGTLPFGARISAWNELRREKGFETWIEAAKGLPPQWLKRVLKH